MTSSLGQPLVAEIELVAVEKTDKSSLTARLASPEAFKGAGIDYPYALPKLKFHVETRANGEAYIKATSDQPVNEPFVSLLIELGWSSGRLLREYTFLLDPPGFVAEQPAAAAVAPIEPVVVAPLIASVPVPASAPQAEPVPQMVAEPQAASSAVPATAPQAVAEAVPAAVAEVAKPAEPVAVADVPPAKEEVKEAAPVTPKAEGSHAVAGPITVKRGDTLSKIANQTKSSDVSLERMLVALYRANTEAFSGKNMNRLSTGKILRLPETEELAKLQQPEAAAEVRVHVADWNAYRQKLAAANAPATDQRAKQEVAGKISTSIAEKMPAAKESAKEVLKLSKGEAPGDAAAAGGKAKSAKDKAIAKEEDAIAKTKALKEAEQRTAMLEKSVKDMQRLVELKNQAAAAKLGQDKLGAASAPASVVPLVASAVAATSEVAAATPKPKAIAPKVVTPPPSLIDDILGNPVYLGGGAAVLLGLGGLAFMRTRRTKTDDKKVSGGEEVGSATGRIAAPVMPSPETGDFTNAAVSTSMAVNVDEVDPIGEADMFLNFGRDVQAEEVLKDALHKDPSNIPVKLKLLSIYATRKDTKSFYIYALEIKQSGDEAAWGQAAAMGRALEPNNALYGGSGDDAVAAPAEDVALPAVDFDLGFGGKEQEQSAATFDVPAEIAPDVSLGEKTVIMSASELRAAQEAPMDFDVTGTHPGIKPVISEEPKLDLPAMDFDVTADSSVAKIAISEEPKLEIPAMDFDVAVPSSAPALAAEIPVEETPALNLDDLVFDVTSTHQAKEAPAAATPAVEADQGMAFTIDFPTEVKPEAAAQSAAPVKDVGLSEISLSLDGVDAPAASAAVPKGEHWQEVATKLDLAKAYQEMGDQDGAREILEEVLRDGDEAQRETAQALLAQLV
ncbi:MAG: FimV/HubP family polar landmark protein [Gallionellaceae bacterium]